MRKKKFEFFDCIKAFLLALPMLFVAVTSLYVIVNQNAKDSFSDYTDTTLSQVSYGDYVENHLMYQISYSGGFASSPFLYVDYNKTNIVELYFPGENWVVDRFSPTYEGERTRLIVYDENGIQHNVFNWHLISPTFYFYSATDVLINSNLNYHIYLISYTTGTLDNVIPFAMTKFNQIGFGKINFLEWFTSLFIQSGYESNVYVVFLNSYINYFLFTELSLFIPSVFHWVIHFFSDLGKDMTHSHRKEN